ncbi:MAG: hypothetical protein FWG45_03865, partial [Oscillospiraceae bacterium]|nr:hypothetical protein [Oscillospiraceae bacterium]
IICGDFGFVWDGSKREKRVLKWLGKRRYDVLFVDGVHENFDELEQYEVSEWCGGKVRNISGKLRQLMRGSVFEIDGKRVLAFGGGDKIDDVKDGDEKAAAAYSDKCVPQTEDFDKAMAALEKVAHKVDYIVSYEPPTIITEFLALGSGSISTSDNLSYFLDEINRKTDYQRWFFGRHHIDKIVPPKYFSLFANVISAEHNPMDKKN